MPPPPMNRNVADSNPRGPDVTNLPRTWITPDDYFHNLAMSMPVTEDSTNAISEPRLVRSTVPVNDLRSAIPPNWTSHATDLWHQYPENWTQLDHNSNPLLSMPVLKYPINSAIDTRDVPDGRFAQTGHQGPKPGVFQERRCHWEGCTYTGRFSCESSLMRHLRATHVSPNVYKCPHVQCERTFGRKDKLQEHLRGAHKTSDST